VVLTDIPTLVGFLSKIIKFLFDIFLISSYNYSTLFSAIYRFPFFRKSLKNVVQDQTLVHVGYLHVIIFKRQFAQAAPVTCARCAVVTPLM